MRPLHLFLTSLLATTAIACGDGAGPEGPAGGRGAKGDPGEPGEPGPRGPAGSSTGRVGGRVTDQLAGSGISGAEVRFAPGSFVAVTDESGTYQLDLPPGVFTAEAVAPSYEKGTPAELALVAGATLALDLVLAPSNLLIADAGVTQWQAGFGVEVVLDGSASSAPGGAPLSYEWIQISGPIVALSGADTATLRFTTKPLDQVIADGDTDLRLPERLTVIGFSGLDVAATRYVFELTVRSGSFSKSVRATVQSVSRHGGLENVPIGALTYVAAPEQVSYAWTCTVDGAPCAAGVLTDESSRTPAFRPTEEGLYDLTEAAAGTLTLNAAHYIGSRRTDSPAELHCESCHASDLALPGRTITDKFGPWSETKHATSLQRQLDGLSSPHFNESCLECHSVGFNLDSDAGGFDDRARALGWTFPATLEPGNYDALPSELKSLGAVGCESCHGPGSGHASFVQTISVGRSFSAADCNQCHANEPYQAQGIQWETSAHSRFISGLVTPATDDPSTRGSCAACHSTQGFALWTKTGIQNNPPPTGDDAEPQTCTACHDPHGEARQPDGRMNPRQLRVFDSVTTIAGFGAESAGAGALCMQCHNSRKTFSATGQSSPHTPSQADILLGKNVETFDLGSYPVSPHAAVPQACVGCHMAPTPAAGEPGRNLVGGHTFNVRSGEVENLAACTSCHQGLETFNRTAYGDFDGDGVVAGIQDEVTGLEQLVAEAISTAAGELWPVETGGSATLAGFHGRIRLLVAYTPGVSDPACDPAVPGEYAETCFAFPSGAIPTATDAERDLVRAAWNLLLIEGDHSGGIHNPAFVVSALQRSYRALTGVEVPNATIRR